MMATPRILLSFDQAVLSTNSPDTLVLSRKVNNTYSTAFAVASLNPRDSSTSQLFSQNVFAWEDSFRVLVSHNHSGSASALSASITNAVDVRHGEAVKFSRNMLLPATKIPDFAELHGKEKGGILFTVADMPVACRVEVMQVVGGNKSARIYQSEEAGGMSRVADVEVSDTFMLFWTERNVPLGGRVVAPQPGHGGFEIKIDTHQSAASSVAFVRFGYVRPDQPDAGESPSWYLISPGSAGLLLDDSAYSLVRITR